MKIQTTIPITDAIIAAPMTAQMGSLDMKPEPGSHPRPWAIQTRPTRAIAPSMNDRARMTTSAMAS